MPSLQDSEFVVDHFPGLSLRFDPGYIITALWAFEFSFCGLPLKPTLHKIQFSYVALALACDSERAAQAQLGRTREKDRA